MGESLICLTPCIEYNQAFPFNSDRVICKGKKGTNLHLNIQHHTPPTRRQILNRLLTRPIPIPAKLRMLHKLALLNHLLELLHADIIVIDIACLAWARVARCVGDGGCEGVGMAVEEQFVECAFPYA